jgi:hypothetical protein
MNVPDEQLAAAAERVAARMEAGAGRAPPPSPPAPLATLEVRLGDDEVARSLVDDAFDLGIFVAGQDDELVRRRDGLLVLGQRELDGVGAGGIVALADERDRLVRRAPPRLLLLRAALVVLLERFLVLLGPSKPVLAV